MGLPDGTKKLRDETRPTGQSQEMDITEPNDRIWYQVHAAWSTTLRSLCGVGAVHRVRTVALGFDAAMCGPSVRWFDSEDFPISADATGRELGRIERDFDWATFRILQGQE